MGLFLAKLTGKPSFQPVLTIILAPATHQFKEFSVIFRGFEFIHDEVHRFNIIHIRDQLT
jgi:hypothetical protein